MDGQVADGRKKVRTCHTDRHYLIPACSVLLDYVSALRLREARGAQKSQWTFALVAT